LNLDPSEHVFKTTTIDPICRPDQTMQCCRGRCTVFVEFLSISCDVLSSCCNRGIPLLLILPVQNHQQSPHHHEQG
jgi:hypothetical protein